LNEDPDTMGYNAGYDVSYEGYHYDTGCIDFSESRWETLYLKRKNDSDRFFAYIKDNNTNGYVGYVNYHLNKNENRYECGIVIEGIHRGKGYSKEGLKLLCDKAFSEDKITALYDNFEEKRTSALKVFESVGFKVFEKTKSKKFDELVDGVVVCIKKEDYIR
jgi:RimJ/RimL family protein N-acetyltransferase